MLFAWQIIYFKNVDYMHYEGHAAIALFEELRCSLNTLRHIRVFIFHVIN